MDGEIIMFAGSKVMCTTCGGTGYVMRGYNPMFGPIPMPCLECNGKGFYVVIDNPKNYKIVVV